MDPQIKNVSESLTEWEELATFSNIKYTPAWYYKQFPGFYNIECYKILAANTKIIPMIPEETPVLEESNSKNKKRSYDEVETSIESI